MLDRYCKDIEASIQLEKQAAEQADALVRQLENATRKLKDWRDIRVGLDVPIPTARQVSDLREQWLAAKQRAGELLRDAHHSDPNLSARLQKLYPDVQMDTTVHYRGRDQTS